jgi:hypothetical protein
MPLVLPFVAEQLFAAMINRCRTDFFSLSGLSELADMTYVNRAREVASTEMSLAPYGGRAFDGASRIDVLVQLGSAKGAAFELKLGATRLSKTRFEKELLKCCEESSHGDRRWTGNMIAILDRRFSEGVDGELIARVSDGTHLAVVPKWFLVVRRRTKSTWQRVGGPAFRNAEVLSFEDLVDGCLGREGFNALVRELLPADFYQAWVGDYLGP